MRVIILKDAAEVSRRAADIFVQTLQQQPSSVLGLATGGTPLGTYQELVKRFQGGEVSFSETTTFNLDEYVGLPRDHSQSYYTFMHEQLFRHADFQLDRCHLPNGEGDDLAAECERYEQLIDDAGGIDLQLLGIGSDGHIAFNEPGSSLASRTRLKALTEQTRRDNARFFESADEVPRLAITMGVGTILEAGQILILATGANKAAATQAFIEGPITAQVPASALQLHPCVTALLDEAAAASLSRLDYYRYVESIQAKLDAGQPA